MFRSVRRTSRRCWLRFWQRSPVQLQERLPITIPLNQSCSSASRAVILFIGLKCVIRQISSLNTGSTPFHRANGFRGFSLLKPSRVILKTSAQGLSLINSRNSWILSSSAKYGICCSITWANISPAPSSLSSTEKIRRLWTAYMH